MIVPAAVAAVLLAVGGTTAVLLQHKSATDSAVSSSPQLAAAPTATPLRVPLVPDLVPFVTAQDRTRIRDEYMTAADYKALAMNLLKIAFVTGQATQEAADRAAMEVCEKQDPARQERRR